jgi:hypothetical protein
MLWKQRDLEELVQEHRHHDLPHDSTLVKDRAPIVRGYRTISAWTQNHFYALPIDVSQIFGQGVMLST